MTGLYGTTSESTGLYGVGQASGGTYFQWLIFKENITQPSTPTGGTWSFTTNTGTAPTGWSTTPPINPGNSVWLSWAVVDSRDPSTLTWSTPGKFTDGYEEKQYGSFYDTTTQSIANTANAQVININSTAENNGVSIVAGNKITFTNQRTYSFTFSMQFQNTDTSIQTAVVWLKYNGTDYPNSASKFDIPSSHGGTPGSVIGTVNFVNSSAPGGGDYVQLYWSGTSTLLSLKTIAAGTSPVYPQSPSVILTVVQV